MPFKSQAQRRKFAQLLVEGKTGRKKLPERVRAKAKSSRTTSRRTPAATKNAKKR
jgi:hypothetical protein